MMQVEDALELVLKVAGKVRSRPGSPPAPSTTASGGGETSDGWTETLPLWVEASSDPKTLLGRRLAEDVVASDNHPPFRASIMDGYAVVASDGPGVYPVVQQVTAGSGRANSEEGNEPKALASGQVSYITTGAPVPKGADAVVRVEDTADCPQEGGIEDRSAPSGLESSSTRVLIKTKVEPGKWIREIGSDVQKGSTVLQKGTILGPAEIGLLASIGATSICLERRPIIGIMSTGDELVESSTRSPGSLRASQSEIRDSNRPMLMSAAHTTGAVVLDLGIAPDNVDMLEASLISALKRVDILVTSGGVSMGSKDFLKSILSNMRGSRIHFGRVRMKPGKPATFASVDMPTSEAAACQTTKLVFALPGNPVSSLVTFQLFVEPAVRRLFGFPHEACHHSRVQARLAHSLPIDPVRREYHRASLEWHQKKAPLSTSVSAGEHNVGVGEFVATSTGAQRSSRLMSMVSASVLLCLPRATQKRRILPAGTVVSALLLSRGMVPAPPTVIPHVQDYVDTPTTSRSVSSEAKAKGQDSAEEGEPTCPCCRAAGRKSSPKSLDSSPPPLSGGSASAGGEGIRIGVLTVSDRASRGEYADRGGPEVLRCIAKQIKSQWTSEYRVVPDDQRVIEREICDLCDRLGCNMIVTTGGTGSSPRDVTPEATENVCDRMFPGFGEMMRSISMRYVPTAILSRQTAGTRGATLVLNLPGNPGSIGQILPYVMGPAAHCINLAGGPLMIVGEPVLSSDMPIPSKKQAYTLDAANVSWINAWAAKLPKEETASSVVARVMQYVRQPSVDQSLVYTKKRGCGRKKRKESVSLFINADILDYLNSAVEKFNLPGLGKAIRIVLDYAMEEDGIEDRIFA